MDELLAMGFEVDQIRQALSNTSSGDLNAAIEYIVRLETSSSHATIQRTDFDVFSSSSDETVVALDISQYTFSETGGSSACTAIAGAALKYLIYELSGGNFHSAIDRNSLETAILSGVIDYNALQLNDDSNSHTSIDQILPSILHDGKLSHVCEGLEGGVMQGMLTDQNCFLNLFDKARLLADGGMELIPPMILRNMSTSSIPQLACSLSRFYT